VILEDLFNQAAIDSENGFEHIGVDATVTKNQTGGFKSSTNTAVADAPVRLFYSPQQVFTDLDDAVFIAATFSSSEPPITITSTIPLFPSSQYGVKIFGESFVPTVDPATNIVYGAAGSVFVTISLCSYSAPRIPRHGG
jgi:hypothetical protein